MPGIVALRDFVGELDLLGDQVHAYVNRLTGEFVSATDEELSAIEDEDEDDEDDDRPGWQKERFPQIREVLASNDWLPLPSKWDIDEYRIMEDFCSTISDNILRGDLLDAIGGRGTFGRFKNMLQRHNLQDRWYRFREDALRKFAVNWLTGHGITYRE